MFNHDIIYFTISRVDSEYSSPAFSLAKEFAKENRVFYLNHPYSIKDFIGSVLKSQRLKSMASHLLTGRTKFETIPETPDGFISVVPPLTLPINWLPRGGFYNLLSKVNDRIMIGVVRKIIKRYNLQSYIYINSYDPLMLRSLPKSLNPTLTIYQSIDDISQDPYTKTHGVKLEKKAAELADIVLVTSSRLKKKLIAFNENTYILNNAVDISIFSGADNNDLDRPVELLDIKGPIIGFTGNLDNLRIDFPLIKSIALANTDKTLVLVGPINSDKLYELEIDQIPNVKLVGAKNIEKLPQYLKFMDVTIIPFLCNELTESIYPLKVNEYLAMGRPVVATKFSTDISTFKKVISLAEDQQHFLDLIKDALAYNSEEMGRERKLVASMNTWHVRKKEFWNIVSGFK